MGSGSHRRRIAAIGVSAGTAAGRPARGRIRPPPATAAAAPSAVDALSLVDAFAALLSAEERIGIAPSAAPRLSGSANDDRVIEEVTQRVLARLSDQARPSILDVAERLVRDEIERIKQNR